MALIRYQDPFVSLRREMNDLLSSFFHEPVVGRAAIATPERTAFFAPIDVKEANGNYIVKMDVPGVNEQDIKVTCQNEALTITGERKLEKEEKKENVHYREIQYGSFSRIVALPGAVDKENVRATYKDGVLEVKLAKAKGTEAREIRIDRTK